MREQNWISRQIQAAEKEVEKRLGGLNKDESKHRSDIYARNKDNNESCKKIVSE